MGRRRNGPPGERGVLDELPRTRTEISALLEPAPSQGALNKALTILVQKGKAARTGRGTKGDPHRWCPPTFHSFTTSLLYVNEWNPYRKMGLPVSLFLTVEALVRWLQSQGARA